VRDCVRLVGVIFAMVDLTLAALNIGPEMMYGDKSSKNMQHFFILLVSGG